MHRQTNMIKLTEVIHSYFANTPAALSTQHVQRCIKNFPVTNRNENGKWNSFLLVGVTELLPSESVY